jgi:hypothetical protein
MEEQATELKKYFDISETKTRVTKLKQTFKDYVGLTLDKDQLKSLLKKALEVLPQDLSMIKIQDSMAHLYGRPLTEQVLNETAWRLAGNTEMLRRGETITQDVSVRKAGWCAVQVTYCRPYLRNPKSKDKKQRGCILTCFILCGHAAGLTIDKFMSLKHLRYLATDLGFTPPFKNMPFRDERELFGMRFGVLCAPDLARDNKPSFKEVCVTSAMQKWNKDIIKRRFRDNFNCPLGKTSEQLPCFRCWRGTESCLASVHVKDFESGFCEYCGKESVFDPLSVGHAVDKCVNCQRHEDTTGAYLFRSFTENVDGNGPTE